MTVTEHWQYLNLNRNSFFILFPAKAVVGNMEIISNLLCVRLKETC